MGSGPKKTLDYPGPIRVKALESLLLEKGLLSQDTVRQQLDDMAREWQSWPGAKVVARAWTEPAFKHDLLTDPKSALGDIGANVTVVENTDAVHNVIVCSLCSCYPVQLLGLPPDWYTSVEYRSRMVIEPRSVLREFGLALPEQLEIRVWDSVAKSRYMVLPQRPSGTEHKSVEELAELLTLHHLTGTAR